MARMKQQQAEQEQFNAFEDMIRRQELEKERLRVVQQFGTATLGPSEDPLIPGVLKPPTDPQTLMSGGQPLSPAGGSGLPRPPVVDRSLKPGALGNSENSMFWNEFGTPSRECNDSLVRIAQNNPLSLHNPIRSLQTRECLRCQKPIYLIY